MGRKLGMLLAVLISMSAFGAADQVAPPATGPDDPVLKEIADVRNGIIDAFNKRDIDRVLSYLHPDIVVTWADAEVSHGPAEVKKYYEKMITSPNHIVESLQLAPVVDGRSLYGPNVAISYGHLNDEFKLTDGTEFKMDSRFSSLLVKENGKWLMKGFHASGNLFDNPVQKIILKKMALWTAMISIAIGLLFGYLGARLMARRKAAKPAQV